MKGCRYKPRRRLRSEAFALVSVFAILWAIGQVFPREALGPRTRVSSSDTSAEASCAFVKLTPAQEAAALAAARTSWQTDTRSARETGIDMLPRVLPEAPPSPVAGLAPLSPLSDARRAAPRVRLLPPTASAPSPARIPREEGSAAKPAFSRELLLHID